MKISIITIVYNRKSVIADCIESVLKQKCDNLEYVIIDGGSTDGTQEIIESYKDKIDCYISEKDDGIFNALNKGVQNSTGDVVGILNSDDLFYSENTLAEIQNAFKISNADLVYAKGLFVDKNDQRRVKRIYPSLPFKKWYLNFGWIPLHTTIFVKKELFEKYGMYSSGYLIASDYEMSLRWFKNDEIKKFFLNSWVVKMRLGGLSTSIKLQLRKSREDLKIIRLYKLAGFGTLFFKIARKIPHYLQPMLFRTTVEAK